jgi:NADH-quinone oxidoreductase subunit J
MNSVLLIAAVLVGALGLYLLMPGARLSFWRVAAFLLAAAGAAFVAVAAQAMPERAAQIWFGVFAVIGLIGAVRVVTSKQPVYSALFFVLVVLCVTGLLVLLGADFLGFGLLAIYAGAILVTYMFVIMLAQQNGTASYDHTARQPLLGVLAGFLLLGAISGAVVPRPAERDAVAAQARPLTETGRGTVRNVGVQLMTTYVVGIQLAGVLLLSSMVGAIAIARRRASTGEMVLGEVD